MPAYREFEAVLWLSGSKTHMNTDCVSPSALEQKEIKILPANSTHAAQVRDIYAYFVTSSTCTFETVAPTEDDMLSRIATAGHAGLPFLVACAHGQVLGYAYASLYRGGRPAYIHTVEDTVYVRADSSSKGLGSQLLRRLLEGCAQAGKKQAIAVIGGAETEGSIRLHEKLGFNHCGKLAAVGFKFDRWLDTCLMQKAL